jgi:hypothetical protein
VTSVIFAITLKGPLHKHASLVVNPYLTFGKKTNIDRLAENFARIVSGHNISSVGAWHL